MDTSKGWREEFDKKFGQGKPGSQDMLLRTNIKDFIQSTLDSQLNELEKQVQAKKKGEAFMRDEALMIGGYNQALRDTQVLIDSLKQK